MTAIRVYIDEEVEAESVEELRAKAADLAEEAWRRELTFRAELATRPPPPPYDPVVSAETARRWGEKLVREVTAPGLPFSGDAEVRGRG